LVDTIVASPQDEFKTGSLDAYVVGEKGDGAFVGASALAEVRLRMQWRAWPVHKAPVRCDAAE
jgi:hypothetical protein